MSMPLSIRAVTVFALAAKAFATNATRAYQNKFLAAVSCGTQEGSKCCLEAAKDADDGIGSDGCDTSSHLDCVDGTCKKCGVNPGLKCCDDHISDFGSDGCDTLGMLECITEGYDINLNTCSERCGAEEGDICCMHIKGPLANGYYVGSDGCVTAKNLDCVGNRCRKCGVSPGSTCCDTKNRYGVGSDGCDTSNNLDCVCRRSNCVEKTWTRKTCEKCGVEEGLKCCDTKSAHGVGRDGCSSEFVCRDEKCRKK